MGFKCRLKFPLLLTVRDDKREFLKKKTSKVPIMQMTWGPLLRNGGR